MLTGAADIRRKMLLALYRRGVAHYFSQYSFQVRRRTCKRDKTKWYEDGE